MTQLEIDDNKEENPANVSLVGKTRMQDDPELERVWIDYKDTPNLDLKNDLLERYLPIVRYTADRLHMKLPQQVDVEDLYSAGIFGLMDAIDNYDLTRGVKFESYCSTRVRGSILDSLRKQDWVPRLVRSTANKIDAAWKEFQNQNGREPTDFEMAIQLGVDDEEFEKMQREASAASMTSISEQISDEGESRSLRKIDVLHDVKAKAPDLDLLREAMMEFIYSHLDKREQAIMTGYYKEGLTMKAIGDELHLSESRVCQLHSRIMSRLRQVCSKHRLDFMQE
ncbi:MAG: FliA/WhiG family RNA polymerase sigma factor [Planctomycetota bacterium]|nr:FliA/WhiG family RNA polymerase sigma factor [Planctomycetota bacterium]